MWDPHTMWNDRQKSFRGAHFFRLHPRTGEFSDFGTLFPNEGVGVLALDEKRARCVGVTYPIGRMFFIQKDGTDLVDMGRMCESYTLSLIHDGRHHVYATDTYAYFMRIDMRNRSVERLGARVPQLHGATGRYTPMCDSRMGPDGWIYFSAYRMPYIFRFKPVQSGELSVEKVGEATGDGATGLAFGDDGMLYIASGGHLNRFDIRRKKIEDLGVLHVRGAARRYWRCVKGKDGRLYAGECGRRPISMIIIDPRKL